MKLNFLNLLVGFFLSVDLLCAATVGVTIGGQSDSLLFESSDGSSLNEGTLFIGAFDGTVSAELELDDILLSFEVFGSVSATSGPLGNFPTTNFTGNVIPSGGSFDFRNLRIFVLVVDTDSISEANEFAFFTASSQANWFFPNFDDADLFNPSANRTDIILNEQNDVLVGRNDTLDPDGAGALDSFASIQLFEVEESVPLVIPAVCFVVSNGRPGIEFEFPTAQAGTVDFVLEESQGDTLLEEDWIEVQASPSVVSDDGTTQTIRIIHPQLISSDSRRFFRLAGSN